MDVEPEDDDKKVTKSMIGRSSSDITLVETARGMNRLLRLFRPLEQGSIRSSVFTLFSGSVGAGVLSLPKVMSYYGLGAGIIAIIFCALLAYTSYSILFSSIRRSKRKRYPNLVNYYLGVGAAKSLAVGIILVQFLAVVIYVCIGKSISNRKLGTLYSTYM